MAFNQCLRMVPLVGRRLASQPARTFFSPWSRPSDIGALIRDMDRQMDRLERQVFRGLPASLLPRRALDFDHTVESQDAGQYRVAVDLAGFKPEEIKLDLDDAGRRLTISAKCERVHRDGSRFAQEVSRSITLPESIDTDSLTSVLHHDGVLAIEAPFKEQARQAQGEPHKIPIGRAGGEAKLGEAPRVADGQHQDSASH